MTSATAKFASEGFDLDAAVNDSDVLELGGGVTRLQVHDVSNSNNNDTNDHNEEKEKDDPISAAESHKAQGNKYFAQERNYAEAIECYTAAIEATPGHPTGLELLQMREAWQEEQDRQWRQKLAQVEQERRDEAKKRRQAKSETEPDNNSMDDSMEDSSASSLKKNDPPERPKEVFQPPAHPFGEKLAVYHCNRAAAYLQLQQEQLQHDLQQQQLEHYQEAVNDCDMALLLNPRYLKALGRRATAYEKLDKTDLALADVQAALQIDPTNKELRQRRDRLQKIEDERLERLKAETMDKLKDLGNSILGNFGLSLDNFKAVQDPNTGSYSISFQQQNNN